MCLADISCSSPSREREQLHKIYRQGAQRAQLFRIISSQHTATKNKTCSHPQQISVIVVSRKKINKVYKNFQFPPFSLSSLLHGKLLIEANLTCTLCSFFPFAPISLSMLSSSSNREAIAGTSFHH